MSSAWDSLKDPLLLTLHQDRVLGGKRREKRQQNSLRNSLLLTGQRRLAMSASGSQSQLMNWLHRLSVNLRHIVPKQPSPLPMEPLLQFEAEVSWCRVPIPTKSQLRNILYYLHPPPPRNTWTKETAGNSWALQWITVGTRPEQKQSALQWILKQMDPLCLSFRSPHT